MLRPDDRILDLHELLDRITDLLIQNTAVGNHKNRVNHRMTIFLKTDQLMCKPCYRV